MDHNYEAALQRQYPMPNGRVLGWDDPIQSVEDGVRYFDKAEHRRQAMNAGKAEEPIGVKPVVLNSAPKRKKPEPSDRKYKPGVGFKYHWVDSFCTKVNYKKWAWETRERILGGDEFDRVPEDEQCYNCRCQFQDA